MLKKYPLKMFLPGLCLCLILLGCAGAQEGRSPASWAFTEVSWIKNGEPLSFEDEPWFPRDAVENLLDSEVYPVGEYRSVKIYAEFLDVRPYNRLYTRFAKNKYRLFEKNH